MFPWIAHGHLFPFLELAKKLSSRNFHIHFCSTPINLDSIKTNLPNSIELIELNLPSLPDLPPHYHTNKNVPPHLMPLLLQAFQMSAPVFTGIVASLDPDLLIYDAFQPWAAKAAATYSIPAVFFSTANSASMAFFHHMYTHKNCDSFPHQEIRLREYELRDLIAQSKYMEEVQGKDEGFAFGVLRLSSEVVLVKSCGGIEDKYAEYLSKLSERRVLFTGVLVAKPEREGLEIMKWLKERKPRSVLYISFGSENYLSKEQMVEMAKGLEKTSVGFIWVARPPAVELPEGFEERTKKRGVVVREWVPQGAILADEGVGGFVTHCGWGSVSESAWFGVPVVGMPLKYDQTVNARMAVEAGIGVEVAREGNGEIEGGAVAEAVEKVMGEGGELFRRRVGEWRKKMEVEEVGAIDQVVKELSRLCANK
ncbi:beta-D-glucosyl crocetin beta-1,6-glucosyltransferase-like [Salvia splendens]|uniref:beta-D-glucosyl crocetin beta-1,6-glucosyltransferase-like n=1 Tax=Salvia splendens TaxID=180675 RepID=UPI001C256C88|nr:beta-D-glucosyl crocetin beta-1,6-glucosyltransferase-like [Salvia splendens]